ncbi:hypothetical protein ADUPG1_007724 [Aduncisulcus paluster]|uniref:DUF7886 domain-containing protein n=1 Tax=Aduncisulcus paluster TaxID=2918883 RepID=A0ABQ5KQS7_9EUKA|nr:hypothetical protein ADUPG1_007724 [Aduncisulcus paluster]
MCPKVSKVAEFLKEFLILCSLEGFQYVTFETRGREEMMVKITPPSSFSWSKTMLKGEEIDKSLAPASPRYREILGDEIPDNSGLFLLAFYQKYGKPGCWARNIKESEKFISDLLGDDMIQLHSLSDWRDHPREAVLRIICELVDVSCGIKEAFKLNFDAIRSYLHENTTAQAISLYSGLIELYKNLYSNPWYIEHAGSEHVVEAIDFLCDHLALLLAV